MINFLKIVRMFNKHSIFRKIEFPGNYVMVQALKG